MPEMYESLPPEIACKVITGFCLLASTGYALYAIVSLNRFAMVIATLGFIVSHVVRSLNYEN
jgi:hypothetical protein